MRIKQFKPNCNLNTLCSKDERTLEEIGLTQHGDLYTQPTPPPLRPSRLQNFASYPRGLISSSLTEESS